MPNILPIVYNSIFSSQKNLNKIEKKQIKIPYYYCKVCNKGYVFSSSYTNHMHSDNHISKNLKQKKI